MFVPTLAELDDLVARFFEQGFTLGMSRQQRAVARKRHAQRFGQTVHRVRGKHARARATGWARRAFQLGNVIIRAIVVSSTNDGGHEVCFQLTIGQNGLTRFHRAARNKDRRDVQTHRRHQHARRDLVTVRDTDQRVRTMGVGHIFHRVSDDFTGRQGIEHAVMPHSDTVIDRDGVHFLGNTACLLDFARNQLAEVFEVHVARDEFRERVHNRHNRLSKVTILHTGCTPQRAGGGHAAAKGCGLGT